eukprot:2316795-Rhodomonas_salina.1
MKLGALTRSEETCGTCAGGSMRETWNRPDSAWRWKRRVPAPVRSGEQRPSVAIKMGQSCHAKASLRVRLGATISLPNVTPRPFSGSCAPSAAPTLLSTSPPSHRPPASPEPASSSEQPASRQPSDPRQHCPRGCCRGAQTQSPSSSARHAGAAASFAALRSSARPLSLRRSSLRYRCAPKPAPCRQHCHPPMPGSLGRRGGCLGGCCCCQRWRCEKHVAGHAQGGCRAGG